MNDMSDWKEADRYLEKHKDNEEQETPIEVLSNNHNPGNPFSETRIGRTFWARVDSMGRVTLDAQMREAYNINQGDIVYLNVKTLFERETNE